MMELIGIGYSPWTEKARWALDHYGAEYRYREHLILLGNPELMFKMRSWTESPTVPALIDGSVRLADSLAIAKHADRLWREGGAGARATLFPEGADDEINRCNEISERGLDAGRAIMMRKLMADRDAQLENLPRPLRSKALLGLVGLGVNYVARAFGADRLSDDKARETLRATLSEASERLKRGGGRFVLGQFSYADVTLALLLQFARPVSDEFLKLGRATRDCWADDALAREFSGLLDWRDSLYRAHRASRR